MAMNLKAATFPITPLGCRRGFARRAGSSYERKAVHSHLTEPLPVLMFARRAGSFFEKNMKEFKTAMIIVAALALFDAIVNGAMSSAMRADGWSALDQAANDSYQFGFALIAAVAVILLQGTMNRLTVVLLLAGYVEDTLYYLLLPVVSPLTEFLSGHPGPDYLFPEKVSGWLGWVGRNLFEEQVALDMWFVFIINAIFIVGAIAINVERLKNPISWVK